MGKTKRPPTPSHKRIAEANRQLLARIDGGMTVEEGAATCWACGSGGVNEAQKGLGWLERAHVVAVAAGGDSDPSNFFLLCHICHKEQPDGASREAQESWLINHESQFSRIARQFEPAWDWLQQQIQERGLDFNTLDVDGVLGKIRKNCMNSEEAFAGRGSNSVTSGMASWAWNVVTLTLDELTWAARQQQLKAAIAARIDTAPPA